MFFNSVEVEHYSYKLMKWKYIYVHDSGMYVPVYHVAVQLFVSYRVLVSNSVCTNSRFIQWTPVPH